MSLSLRLLTVVAGIDLIDLVCNGWLVLGLICDVLTG